MFSPKLFYFSSNFVIRLLSSKFPDVLCSVSGVYDTPRLHTRRFGPGGRAEIFTRVEVSVDRCDRRGGQLLCRQSVRIYFCDQCTGEDRTLRKIAIWM